MLYDVPAPAKLNLFLHVVGRRADGYHLLQTVFRFIDLCDTLHFDVRHDGQLSCANSMAVSTEDDLIIRAARALQQATGTRLGAHVICHKHIPAGGGLGGGSSDAATTLIALNRLWQTGLDRAALMQLGARLGADVPVFLFGQSAFAEGIGDELTAVSVPDDAYLVVQPQVSVATSAVFLAPDLTRNTESIKIAVFTDWQASNSNRFFGQNNLEPVVMSSYPVVRQAKHWLVQQGVPVRMTGAGACLFAQYPNMQLAGFNQRQIAGKIASGLAPAAITQVWACAGLPDHPLRYW